MAAEESPLPKLEDLPPALVGFLVEAKRYMRDRRVGSLKVWFAEGGVPTLVEQFEQQKFPK